MGCVILLKIEVIILRAYRQPDCEWYCKWQYIACRVNHMPLCVTWQLLACRWLIQAVNTFAVNRFYLTLMLHNLWKQNTVWHVSARFQLPRGFVEQLLMSAASFAACISHFCQVCFVFGAVALVCYELDCISVETRISRSCLVGVKLWKLARVHCHRASTNNTVIRRPANCYLLEGRGTS